MNIPYLSIWFCLCFQKLHEKLEISNRRFEHELNRLHKIIKNNSDVFEILGKLEASAQRCSIGFLRIARNQKACDLVATVLVTTALTQSLKVPRRRKYLIVGRVLFWVSCKSWNDTSWSFLSFSQNNSRRIPIT